MDLVSFFNEKCSATDTVFGVGLNELTKVVSLYVFYRYLNGDDSDFEKIDGYLVSHNCVSNAIAAILPSCTLDGNAVDFLVGLSKDSIKSWRLSDLLSASEALIQEIYHIAIKDQSNPKCEYLLQEASQGQVFDDSTLYTIRFICDWTPTSEVKVEILNALSSIETNNGKIAVEIVFADDIEQEINDIDSPKENVSQGEISLYPGASFCKIGAEESFITIISASSLKSLYLNYATRGLFAANLRLFINSKRIDPLIKETIENSPDNFVYFNNGIIITCDDARVSNGILFLTNFSIVNGCQTTNLIGRTSFRRDFGVVCKVIKNRFTDLGQKTAFLSMVAEASNTQKPINAKDLIANRPEQRLLKIQFAEAGMFLSIKRGEKISKKDYPEAWKCATNDRIAQLIYSCVYQSPGVSKNSKSTILSRKAIYRTIFGTNYNTDFLLSLQHIRVSFSSWVKSVCKLEGKVSIKYGLAKNADLMIFGVIGLFVKLMTNKIIAEAYLSMARSKWNDRNYDFKIHLQQNDIGKIPLISTAIFQGISAKTLFPVFEFCFQTVLIPAYKAFKQNFPNYFYSNFVKSDFYYWNYVVPQVMNVVSKQKVMVETALGSLLNFDGRTSFDALVITTHDDSSNSLSARLTSFRNEMFKTQNVKPYEVFTNMQMSSIITRLPRNKEGLKQCGLNPEQIRKYGAEILQIVSECCDASGFALKKSV